MKNKTLLLLTALLFMKFNITDAQLKDKDGNEYATVKIGDQEWMADNLDVSHFRNGDIIPEATSLSDWMKAGDEGKPAWCYYRTDSNSLTKFGRLYNWYAVTDPRGLAPDGWHMPSTDEWITLINNSGSDTAAGRHFKSVTEWDGSDPDGMNCLPGGYRNNEGQFEHVGKIGSWWTSTEANSDNAWSISLATQSPVISMSFDYKRVGLSVRCVKN